MCGITLCSEHSVNHRGRRAVFTDATRSCKVIRGLTSLPFHSVRHRSRKPDREIRAAVIQASPRRQRLDCLGSPPLSLQESAVMYAHLNQAHECLLGKRTLIPSADLLVELCYSYEKHAGTAFPVQYTQ